MANIASQEKRIHRAERERIENRRRTSQVKTWFRRLENAVGDSDAAKADALSAMLEGPPGPQCPASLIRDHPRLTSSRPSIWPSKSGRSPYWSHPSCEILLRMAPAPLICLRSPGEIRNASERSPHRREATMHGQTLRAPAAVTTTAALQTVYVLHTDASTTSGRLFRLDWAELAGVIG